MAEFLQSLGTKEVVLFKKSSCSLLKAAAEVLASCVITQTQKK
jgi:hypothetical protein